MQSTPSIKDVVHDYWDGIAGSYDTQPGHDVRSAPLRARWQAMLLEQADATAGPLDVVDVGCGTGFLALHFAEAGHRVIGVDASEQMLALAEAKAEQHGVALTLRRGDADALPVEDASADVVCERHVLWTMAEPAVTLAEWGRVLRPGGRLLLVEGDWRDRLTDRELGAEDPEFLHRYRQIRASLPLYGGRPGADVLALVTAAGFGAARLVPLDERELWEGLDRDNPAARYVVRAQRRQ